MSAKLFAVTARVADLWINRYLDAGRRFDNQTGLPEFVEMVRCRRPRAAGPDADLFAAGGRHHPGDEIGGEEQLEEQAAGLPRQVVCYGGEFGVMHDGEPVHGVQTHAA